MRKDMKTRKRNARDHIIYHIAWLNLRVVVASEEERKHKRCLILLCQGKRDDQLNIAWITHWLIYSSRFKSFCHFTLPGCVLSILLGFKVPAWGKIYLASTSILSTNDQNALCYNQNALCYNFMPTVSWIFQTNQCFIMVVGMTV